MIHIPLWLLIQLSIIIFAASLIILYLIQKFSGVNTRINPHIVTTMMTRNVRTNNFENNNSGVGILNNVDIEIYNVMKD